MPEVFLLSAITSGLPCNIYGQSSVHSGENTSFKNNCFWYFFLFTYPKLTDLIFLVRFLVSVNVIYLIVC